MTATKNQMLKNAIDSVRAYKEHCEKANKGFHVNDEFYQDAQMAVSAYANFSGISYDRACALCMEVIEPDKSLR